MAQLTREQRELIERELADRSAMKCPNCAHAGLEPVLTTQGVEIDRCGSCEGVWLDRGEIFLFSKKPKRVAGRLAEALKIQTPTEKLSPVSGEPMVEIVYPSGPHIDYCARTGGLWLEAGELKALLEGEPSIRFSLDRKTVGRRPAEPAPGVREETDRKRAGLEPGSSKAEREARRHARIAVGLLALPNLVLRSTTTLAGLYALLGAVLIAAVEFAGADLSLAVIGGIAIILVQFAIGPYFMDLSLRWLYRMDWVSPAELPDHLRQFVNRVCEEKNIRFPKFGVINDGAPQAFTYGHSPNNARIVISRGIFELLEPDEAEAVVAHEIGHAVHWDMLLMTVVQLVPLIFYYIYRTLIRMKSSGSRKKGESGRIVIAIGAYVLYIVSEYVVLWFSRTREYHADRFSGTVTGNPSALASALVKIAYGLAGQEKAQDEAPSNRGGKMEAIGAMGIFDAGAAQALAIAGYSETAQAAGAVDKENVKGAMRWDLWNPWAKWYELNSTHPLVANRLRYLSDQAVHMGQEPYVVFDEVQPESYWDEFLVDLFVHLLPMAAGVVFALTAGSLYFVGEASPESRLLLPLAVALVGATLLLRFGFAYRSAYFPEMSVAALLKKVKVSAVRPVPCTLKGRVIGRGVPGYIFSEDFVMKDDTGIMFLDYRQPLAIWEWLFGLLKAGRYEDREVVVQGWYRRSPVPYVELKSIELHGDVSRSWVPILNRLSAIALLVGGFGWAAAIVMGVV